MWAFWANLVLFFRDVFDWFTKRKKTIKDDIASAVKVDVILKSLLEDLKADRATVFQFHNGEHFYTGNSIDKMTATHENALRGISREHRNSVGLFASPYRDLLSGMLYNDVYSIENVDKVEDYNSRGFLQERGAVSAYFRVMRDNLNKPVAFLLVENVRQPGRITIMGEELLKQATMSIYDVLVHGRA